MPPAPKKNFRKRTHDDDDDLNKPGDDSDDELQRRMVLEEVKFLQKQRERKMGIPALPTASTDTGSGSLLVRLSGGRAGEGGEDKEEQVLQDTFAQETAVTVEDPNMMRYVELELAKRRGKKVDVREKEEKDQEVDELYVVPDHLKVKKRNSQEQSTQWTTGIAEVQLPIEYKLKNIEETEAAKKQLQEKRLAGNAKPDPSIPASYSADYLHRGRDYAEKLRREHPELYKEQGRQSNEAAAKTKEDIKSDNNPDSNNVNNNKAEGTRREAATDEFMLERFRKREKYRVMHR